MPWLSYYCRRPISHSLSFSLFLVFLLLPLASPTITFYSPPSLARTQIPSRHYEFFGVQVLTGRSSDFVFLFALIMPSFRARLSSFLSFRSFFLLSTPVCDCRFSLSHLQPPWRIEGRMIYAQPEEACDALTNGDALAGNIALVMSGALPSRANLRSLSLSFFFLLPAVASVSLSSLSLYLSFFMVTRLWYLSLHPLASVFYSLFLFASLHYHFTFVQAAAHLRVRRVSCNHTGPLLLSS